MAMPRPKPATPPQPRGDVQELDEATIRFAGDAGDGMQMAGAQFASASALFGNGIGALPDPPSEIRAPAGTLAGVSGFQVHFSKERTATPGDIVNTLVVMNPAALRAHLGDLEPGGLLIANSDTFVAAELAKAGYATNPLEDGSLEAYKVCAIPISTLNRDAVARINLSPREADRCKNFFTLGLVYWLYERPLEPTLDWIRAKFAKNPAVLEANTRSLNEGYQFGDHGDVLPVHYRVAPAGSVPGRYRRVSGNEALALGLVAAAERSGVSLVCAGYPIAPAIDLMQILSDLDHPALQAVQIEDEAAAISFAVGAAFGGALGVTATSGPGMCLKAEGLGLAVMTELPCVVFDVQRGGPSTGLPTKPEQSDLLQALFGRNGECPLVVLAPASPADGFATAFEAVRLALQYMTPVIVLADAHLASGIETWRVPEVDDLPALPDVAPVAEATHDVQPYQRDERLVRPWVIPGTPGCEHRLSGLEKEDQTGNVSYEPLNHEWMVQTRAKKIANIAQAIPALTVDGPEQGDVLVIGWGSTFGTIETAVRRCRRKGMQVAAAHLRYLNPFPANTGEVLRRYRKVLVPELNSGQLRLLLRANFLVDAVGLNKVQGRPLLVREVERKIEGLLGP
jgi:2-oxoglutarate ferredoxin oxidoreductase subunit alpha